jgi:hypothetical protein
VIRPFGRKGEFATTRDFSLGAMMFHFGMQPIEVVGAGVDADGDTVVDEITAGEISALSVFLSSLPRPVRDELNSEAAQGKGLFSLIGCDGCHIPFIESNGPMLPLRFPQVATDPLENVYREVDLTLSPANFDAAPGGGIRVPLFADLKRHDMGIHMAENFALVDPQTNREFTTAKLWGVADSGPWMHDGRAHTLTDAILMHGGEGQAASDAFVVLSSPEKKAILTFLRTLRNPGMAEGDDDGDDDDHDDHDDRDHHDHDHDDDGRVRGFVETTSRAHDLTGGVDVREN